jgi:inosine-uridine nucleoside N-ribohydrolase
MACKCCGCAKMLAFIAAVTVVLTLLVACAPALAALPGSRRSSINTSLSPASIGTPSSPLPGPTSPTRWSVIVDTDVSVDDLMAILFLLGCPDIDIKGITIVHGVAHMERGAQIIRGLLARAGRTDVPVAAGAAIPMQGDHAMPEAWRRSADDAWGLDLPADGAPLAPVSAAQMIRELADQSPGEITVLAIGPLTNIALALQDDPTLAKRLKQIGVGDGAILVPGNIYAEYPAIANQVAGWNLWLDPHAADIVFRSGAFLVVNPLDVTYSSSPRPIVLTRDLAERFRQSATGPRELMLCTLMDTWLDTFGHGKPVPDWDLVSVAMFKESSICSDWRDLAIEVDTGADETAGWTRINMASAPNAQVCIGGDQAAFEALLLDRCR